MSLQEVPVGNDVPDDVNVIIEIPMNSPAIKYEVDKASGAIFVDRMLKTAMHYPCNYAEHFFSHYKDLERGKWVKVTGWEDTGAARREIIDGVERYNASPVQPNF